MALEYSLVQKQKLRISSKLRQAINLLQMGRKELSELLTEELEKNPLLEEVEPIEFNSSSYISAYDFV